MSLIGILLSVTVWGITDTVVVTKGAVTVLTFPSRVVTVQSGTTNEQEYEHTLAGRLVLLKVQHPFATATNIVVITQKQIYYLVVVYRASVDMAVLNMDFSKKKAGASDGNHPQERLRRQLSTCSEAADTMLILNPIDTVIASRIAADYRLQHRRGSICKLRKLAITFGLEDVMKLNGLMYLRWYWRNNAGLPAEIVHISVCMKTAATNAILPLRTCLKLPSLMLPGKANIRQVLVIAAPVIDKRDELYAVVHMRNIADPLILKIQAAALPKHILKPG
ncbi:hypothetical protein [Chitinophaga dinghuensis]|uniref:hypothetical protein n=1 Tax=Chitinophaga dinghuensis TaxID=1539050 RepID=UPI0014756EC4|nr:hypothetical protein [Chitinophaga dinghuensis]